MNIDTEHREIITEKASILSEQIHAKCATDLIDQVEAYATSAQIVIPIKEVQVRLGIAIVTGLGSRGEASNEIYIPINQNFSDVMEEEDIDGKQK